MATQAQLRARALFAKRARAGTWRKGRKKAGRVKKKVRRVKVRKMRVVRRHKPVKVHRKGISMLGGINKKGGIITLLTFYLANGFGELESIINNGGSKFAIRDSALHMKNDHTLGYYAFLASIYKWGDSGLLNALGINDIQIHRKPAAVWLWAINDWAITEPITNGIQAVQSGTTEDAIYNFKKAATASPIRAGAVGVATWKWGAPISIKGVNS